MLLFYRNGADYTERLHPRTPFEWCSQGEGDHLHAKILRLDSLSPTRSFALGTLSDVVDLRQRTVKQLQEYLSRSLGKSSYSP